MLCTWHCLPKVAVLTHSEERIIWKDCAYYTAALWNNGTQFTFSCYKYEDTIINTHSTKIFTHGESNKLIFPSSNTKQNRPNVTKKRKVGWFQSKNKTFLTFSLMEKLYCYGILLLEQDIFHVIWHFVITTHKALVLTRNISCYNMSPYLFISQSCDVTFPNWCISLKQRFVLLSWCHVVLL